MLFRSEDKALRLLSQSVDLGIEVFDTAPIYKLAETYLGTFYRQTSFPITVNTKYGLPKPEIITESNIKESLERSLDRLSGIRIKTLFVHSLPISLLTNEVINYLKQFQKQGYFERLGYSGDNEDLKFAILKETFDDFMLTLNAIDLRNLDYIPLISNNQRIFIKRPLANGIWKHWHLKQIQNSIFKMLGAGRANDPQTYRFRFEKLKKSSPQIYEPRIETFTKLLGELRFSKTIVFGTSKESHLLEILRLLKIQDGESDGSLFNQRLQIWQNFSHYKWQATR